MLIEGRELKQRIAHRGRNSEAVSLYRMSHLPHWVWLVEFHDVKARDRHEPCVLAEIVFDATSHDEAPLTLVSTTASQCKDHGAIRRNEAGITEVAGPGRRWGSIVLTQGNQCVVDADLRVA